MAWPGRLTTTRVSEARAGECNDVDGQSGPLKKDEVEGGAGEG